MASDLYSVIPPRPLPRTRTSLTLQLPTSSTDCSDDGSLNNPIVLDPSEYTARPGDAHRHADFHSFPLQNASSNESLEQYEQPETVISPSLPGALSRPLLPAEQDKLNYLDRLKVFLGTAPSQWEKPRDDRPVEDDLGLNMPSFPDHKGTVPPGPPTAVSHPALHRFLLPTNEYVSCVLWNGLYHISGTDIVRALVFRFEAFGRPVINHKKFEEGVFSDLRNLKPGVDASLEEPKSPFLDLLFKYQCVRTQKKQKVFFWFSVPHDRLFLDALERDLKREKAALESTTKTVGEPALSFTYDSKRSLYEQFIARKDDSDDNRESTNQDGQSEGGMFGVTLSHVAAELKDPQGNADGASSTNSGKSNPSPFLTMFNLFEGSSTYKQRRKKGAKSLLGGQHKDSDDEQRGRTNIRGHHYNPYDSSVSRERGYQSDFSEADDGNSYSTPSSSSGPSTGDAPTAADMFIRQARGELGGSAKPGGPTDPWLSEHGPGMVSAGPGVGMGMGRFGNNHFTYSPHETYGARPRSYDAMQRSPYGQPTASGLPTPGSTLTSGNHPLPYSAGYATTTFEAAHAHRMGYDPMMSNVNRSTFTSSGSPAYPANPLTTVPAPPFAALNNPMGHSIHSMQPQPMSKAFVCPVQSCGKFFKRMEHLKRHLRTHTHERPYACPRCRKRFSRSDNLGQHLKTHEKSDAEMSQSGRIINTMPPTTEESGTDGDGESFGGEDEDIGDVDSSMEGDEPKTTDGSGIGSELNMFGGAMGLGVGMGMAAGVGSFGPTTDAPSPSNAAQNEATGSQSTTVVAPQPQSNIDVNMYEVEAQGQASGERPRESLLMTGVPAPTSSSGVQYSAQTLTGPSGQVPDFSTTEWMRHRQHQPVDSPAFSTTSMPSPPVGAASLTNRSSYAGTSTSPGQYGAHLQPGSRTSSPSIQQQQYYVPGVIQHGQGSAPSSVSSSFADDYLLNQMSLPSSAPSHKLNFDHSSLYPTGMMMESSQGGPVRRHRSMTPSVHRNGVDIRRPGTGQSNSVDSSGSPGERGYHPYAYAAGSTSRAGSTHSSPAANPQPLAGEGSPYRHGDSRRSSLNSAASSASGLQEQMKQMMNLGNPSNDNVYAPQLYRSDSPASFASSGGHGQPLPTESPAQFHSDLPPSNTNYEYGGGATLQPQPTHHAATMPASVVNHLQQNAFGRQSSDSLSDYMTQDQTFYARTQPHMTL